MVAALKQHDTSETLGETLPITLEEVHAQAQQIREAFAMRNLDAAVDLANDLVMEFMLAISRGHLDPEESQYMAFTVVHSIAPILQMSRRK